MCKGMETKGYTSYLSLSFTMTRLHITSWYMKVAVTCTLK